MEWTSLVLNTIFASFVGLDRYRYRVSADTCQYWSVSVSADTCFEYQRRYR